MRFNFLPATAFDGSSQKDLTTIINSLAPYTAHLRAVSTYASYTSADTFINLSNDERNFESCFALQNKMVTPALKYILVVGIGGSSLGTKAVYDALYGYFDNLEPQRLPKVFFLQAVNQRFLGKLTKFLKDNISDPNEILINVVSKSGTTWEVNQNMNVVFEAFPQFANRIVITSAEGSPLHQFAKESDVAFLAIPQKITGRFSFFSAVGLFPLLCAGFDVLSLIEGAQALLRTILKGGQSANLVATATALMYLARKPILNHCFFHDELHSLGDWCNQIIAESLGKELNVKAQRVNAGITPIASIATRDFHSMLQLYLGGPKDKFTLFVLAPDLLHTKTKAIYEAVKKSYGAKGRPFAEIILPDLSEKTLGYFMQFKMVEVLYLAALLGVNPFDQPEVEEYKL